MAALACNRGGMVPAGNQPTIPTRSQLARLHEPDSFLWLTGVEDTFVFDPHPQTGRILDEYALTLHYEHWEQDLALMGSLGVPAARYGIPWYKVEPKRGKFDWSFPDRTLLRMLELGVHPVVDLIHYGTPEWMESSFLNPDFPKLMADYATAVAERYKGQIYWYTPLNEPRITAHYCGRLGWWPPYRHGWKGFVQVLLAVCKGIIETDRALTQVDPEIVRMHVDATDFYETANPDLFATREFKHGLVFLPLDLITGGMTPDNPMWDWVRRQKASDSDLEWFQQNKVTPDLLGINLYPMFSRRLIKKVGNRTRFSAAYGNADLVTSLVNMYWQRYRLPLVISETASRGSVKRRIEWLRDSMQAVRSAREEGIPVLGYTWWPMFSLIGWGYREGDLPFHKYIVDMGLWDLEGEDLKRVHTPVVDEFKEYVSAGSAKAGRLGRADV
jgi:beta-glucosidase